MGFGGNHFSISSKNIFNLLKGIWGVGYKSKLLYLSLKSDKGICGINFLWNSSQLKYYMKRVSFHGYHPSTLVISLDFESQFKNWYNPAEASVEKCFPDKQPHLSVSLDLGVNESPQNVRSDGKVDEDKLRLLMKAEQGEVVTQLHGLDGVFLLLTE